MKFRVLVRKSHRWLALFVGIQVFLWMLSGFFMSYFPIQKIRSEHLFEKPEPIALQNIDKLKDVSKIIELNKISGDIREVRLTSLMERPVYKIYSSNDKVELLDAISGESLSPVGEELAMEIAKAHYKGNYQIAEIQLIKEPLSEYGGKYPVWKVDFDNGEDTSFFISHETGEVRARRSFLWRVFDFMWMLHIMDYKDRSNFNNWWLYVLAFLASIMSLFGLVLLFFSFKKSSTRVSR